MSTSRKRTKGDDVSSGQVVQGVQQQRERIAMTAYFKAQARGFEPGHELEDWLAAEREIAVPAPSVRH